MPCRTQYSILFPHDLVPCDAEGVVFRIPAEKRAEPRDKSRGARPDAPGKSEAAHFDESDPWPSAGRHRHNQAVDFAELVLAMPGVAAKLERRRILERTAPGRADAKAKGNKFGRYRSFTCR